MVSATVEEEGSFVLGIIPCSLHIDRKDIAGVVCDAPRTTILLVRIVYHIFSWRSFYHPENLAYLHLHLEKASYFLNIFSLHTFLGSVHHLFRCNFDYLHVLVSKLTWNRVQKLLVGLAVVAAGGVGNHSKIREQERN